MSKSKARREAKKRRTAESVGEPRRESYSSGAKGQKGKGDSKGSKGKSGSISKQVCYAWNRDEGGCPSPCPNNRQHECERCGSSQHKAKDCPNRK